MNDQGLKSLRRRFPGFEKSLGHAIEAMAYNEKLTQGFTPPLVHGWIEVRPANPHDSLDAMSQSQWIAFIHVKVHDGETYSMPVIPDEVNPRPDKLVRPDDSPHVFLYMHEAETAANKELPGFVRYIKSKL